MKRLFLTSQVHFVADSIAAKLGNDVGKKMVFIETCVKDKVRPGDAMEWHTKNKEGLIRAGFQYDMYDIADKTTEQLQADLDAYDSMYVEGGNTFYLLLHAQKNDFGAYVQQRVNDGMIYIATSAGSIIAGPDTVSGSRPGKSPADYNLTDTKGFGLVNFVTCPHWGDPNKKDMYQKFKIPIAYAENYPYILLSDNQYVEVRDDMYRIVDLTQEENVRK